MTSAADIRAYMETLARITDDEAKALYAIELSHGQARHFYACLTKIELERRGFAVEEPTT